MKVLKNNLNIIINKLKNNSPEYIQNEHNHRNVLDVLIATKLSQNTTDKTAYIAYKNLKNDFKNWEELIDAPISKIKRAIKPCGLTETKSRDIKLMLKQMRDDFGRLNLNHLRKLNNENIYEALLKYKGIGVKTVTCVLAFALNRSVFPVDTHVHRVMNRLGIVKTKSAEETFEMAKRIIPDEEKVFLHKGMIKFGRNVCKAVKPLCGECFLYDECVFEDKELFYHGDTEKSREEHKIKMFKSKEQDQELKRKVRKKEIKSKIHKEKHSSNFTEKHRKEQSKKYKSEKIIKKENNFIILENI